MRRLHPLYTLLLALLVGGNVLYTFVATPVIFARFDRDLAGRVVAAMMPAYFGYGVALFGLATALFVLIPADRAGKDFRISLALLGIGLLTAGAVAAWLYPSMVEVRSQVASFAADAPMTAPRLAFRRLHGLSSALNLLELGVGVALLLLAPRIAPPADK